MNQSRGRYLGSQRSGQRQPSHVRKLPSNRQGQSNVKGSPARDLTQTASIFKTRSFQLLVDAVGAENIALGLDSNLTRVAELIKGERFTPETAFHMETTLGLPHGFFDQPNPVLAAETIARLKLPLDFVQTDVEPEVASETIEPAPAPKVSQQPFLKNRVLEEPEMPKKATGGSPTLVQSRRSAAVQLVALAPVKDSPAKSKTPAKTNQRPPLAVNDGANVQTIRRANLHVLTTRNGSKVKLGALMGLTGSNMAHRLHGKKRMDDAEADRFTERLALPTGWLDTPRSEGDIPESVSRLLLPAPRGQSSVKPQQPPTGPTNEHVLAKSTGARARARAGATSDAESPPVPASASPAKEATVVSLQEHINAPSAELASPATGKKNDAALEQISAAAVPQLPSMPPGRFTSVTSLENLEGIEPIAEALIKTLAGKARTGRLDELKALELLQQAVLL
ncbi:hypothetical protein AWB67_06873 [Caballeronia terrestris]|uniref:Uncharacterized protein n=1 Tax=Caballeronia terrestris TaxID=1226301 RepID=A0A158KVQ9_9BURK|nr:hypothetical protein [Caballeronia terrestris]SAL85177.1 hypothetical protein AWB67_06873 [Caballeronia terrestris]